MDVIICKWLRVRENRLSLIIYFPDYNESWIVLFLNPCAWLSLKRNTYLNKPAAESYRFLFKCVCRRNQEEETRNWGVNVNYQTQGNNRLDNVPYTGFFSKSTQSLSPVSLKITIGAITKKNFRSMIRSICTFWKANWQVKPPQGKIKDKVMVFRLKALMHLLSICIESEICNFRDFITLCDSFNLRSRESLVFRRETS